MLNVVPCWIPFCSRPGFPHVWLGRTAKESCFWLGTAHRNRAVRWRTQRKVCLKVNASHKMWRAKTHQTHRTGWHQSPLWVTFKYRFYPEIHPHSQGSKIIPQATESETRSTLSWPVLPVSNPKHPSFRCPRHSIEHDCSRLESRDDIPVWNNTFSTDLRRAPQRPLQCKQSCFIP